MLHEVTIVQLVERLEENNNLQIELNDNDRTVGFKLGKRDLLNQIRQIVKDIEEGEVYVHGL